jgi:hypothetical protein
MNQALLLAALALTATFLHAQDKAALKRISSVFEAVEENYKYWPHHSITGENLEGGYAFEHHVWQSNDEPPLYRVESLSFDDHGQAKKQFFFKGSQMLFVLDRSEMTPMQEKAATSVVEKRLYFAEGSLIRMLEKAGKFPEGKPTDTTSLKNKDTPVEEVLGAGELYGELEREAQAIMVKVNKISSDDAPATPTTELSIFGDGWRLIRGSQSRNGQYALAWGIQGKSMPEGETDADGTISANDPEAEGLTNYVINLSTGVILGKTNGMHASDKPNSGHYTQEVAWSSASNYFVQICSGKWATFSASFYEISPVDEALSEPIDILEMAKKAAFSNLEGGDLLKKFDKDDFTSTLHDVKIAQRGSKTVVIVEVAGQIPKSEEEGAYFNLTLTFQLMPDENGGRSQLQWTGTESHYD